MTKATSFVFLLTLCAVVASTLLRAFPVQAQSPVELRNVEALVRFGEEIIFTAVVTSVIPAQNVSIVIAAEPQGATYVEPVIVSPDGRTEFHFDTKQNPLRPFAIVNWMYRFTLNDGSTMDSESFSVRYADDRFQWQMLEASALRVHWYGGDASFGQAALAAARAGLESINRLLPVDTSQPLEIFIYSNTDDLRGTLAQGGSDWVAGHADPALGVVMVVVEPGPEQNIAMEQRIPHELMHVMLYRRLGEGYIRLPAWLREGMSTFVELYPNADYDRVLSDAAAGSSLIPIRDLCVSFPGDAGQAFLSYAESRSFVTYLYDTYGSAGLMDLSDSYADGVDCERGPERAFGTSLSSLERDWRSSVLGQNTILPALQGISPYLVLLCLVLVIPFVGVLITLRNRGRSGASHP